MCRNMEIMLNISIDTPNKKSGETCFVYREFD
jgi:hypothetical protein